MEMILLMLMLYGIVHLFTHRPGRAVGDSGWTPSTLTPATLVDREQHPGRQSSAALALGRVEGRLLLRSDAFLVGVLLMLVTMALFQVLWASDNIGIYNTWEAHAAFVPIFFLQLAGMSLIAVNVAALRARSDGVTELFESMPCTPVSKVWGHVLSGWMAILAATAILAGMIWIEATRNGRFGAITIELIGDLVVMLVLVGCAVALGVALAQWVPNVLASVVALVALAAVGTAIGGIGGVHWSPTRQLSIWPRVPDHDPLFVDRPTLWHAVYLAGLGSLMVVVAVARSRRTRGVAVAAAATLGVALVAGVAQTRPISEADAIRVAGLVAEPAANSICRESEALVLCAYPDVADILDHWSTDLMPVAAVVPPDHADSEPFTVLWRERRLDRLDPAVQAHLDVEGLQSSWIADHNTWNGIQLEGPDNPRVNRLAVGLGIVGLPIRAEDPIQTCSAAGQARGLVALWAASRGLEVADADHLVGGSWADLDNPDWPSDVPPEWHAGYVWTQELPAPVVWSGVDVDLASQMVALDHAMVQQVLWEDWDHWIDHNTSSQELATALGVAPGAGLSSGDESIVACS